MDRVLMPLSIAVEARFKFCSVLLLATSALWSMFTQVKSVAVADSSTFWIAPGLSSCASSWVCKVRIALAARSWPSFWHFSQAVRALLS